MPKILESRARAVLRARSVVLRSVVTQFRQCRSLRSFRLDVAWAGERTRDSKLRSFDSARSFAVPIPLLGRDRAARSGRQSRSFRSSRSAEVSPGSTFGCCRSLSGRQNPAVAQLQQLRQLRSCVSSRALLGLFEVRTADGLRLSETRTQPRRTDRPTDPAPGAGREAADARFCKY